MAEAQEPTGKLIMQAIRKIAEKKKMPGPLNMRAVEREIRRQKKIFAERMRGR